MQPHRLADLQLEMLRVPCGAERFMLRVDTSIRDLLGQVMQHVTDIVHQGRHDRTFGSTGPLGKDGTLQRMLELADPFAIAFMAAAREGVADFVPYLFRGRVHAAASVRLAEPRFSTRRRLSMPSRSM